MTLISKTTLTPYPVQRRVLFEKTKRRSKTEEVLEYLEPFLENCVAEFHLTTVAYEVVFRRNSDGLAFFIWNLPQKTGFINVTYFMDNLCFNVIGNIRHNPHTIYQLLKVHLNNFIAINKNDIYTLNPQFLLFTNVYREKPELNTVKARPDSRDTHFLYSVEKPTNFKPLI